MGKHSQVSDQGGLVRFVGQGSYAVDAKGRVSIPADFRAVISQHYGTEELWITTYKWVDENRNVRVPLLQAYPRAEWEHTLESLAERSAYDPRLNNFRRHFVAGATQCFPDKQGRVALTPEQRRHANLERDVMFLGTGLRYFEIWDLATWEKVRTEEEDEAYAGIGDVLKEHGL